MVAEASIEDGRSSSKRIYWILSLILSDTPEKPVSSRKRAFSLPTLRFRAYPPPLSMVVQTFENLVVFPQNIVEFHADLR